MTGLNHPDARTFSTAYIGLTRIFKGLFRIKCVQATNVNMIETPPTSDKNLIQPGQITHDFRPLGVRRMRPLLVAPRHRLRALFCVALIFPYYGARCR